MPGKPTTREATPIAENLKRIREERGMSQAALGELSAISPSYISTIESGKAVNPGAYFVYRLALALRVPMEEIMGTSRLMGRSRIAREATKRDAEIAKQISDEAIASPDD